ncbi:MAG: hypothetical protein KDB14_18400 [Planctomycetales bacterium]|nr:hypothetical protein [Planctomycetales bacterium]
MIDLGAFGFGFSRSSDAGEATRSGRWDDALDAEVAGEFSTSSPGGSEFAVADGLLSSGTSGIGSGSGTDGVVEFGEVGEVEVADGGTSCCVGTGRGVVGVEVDGVGDGGGDAGRESPDGGAGAGVGVIGWDADVESETAEDAT